MKVKELIEALQKMPEEHEVVYYYDGAPRGEVSQVYKDVLYDEIQAVVLRCKEDECQGYDPAPKDALNFGSYNKFWEDFQP